MPLAFLTGNLWRTGTLALLLAVGALWALHRHDVGRINKARGALVAEQARHAVTAKSLDETLATLASQNAAVRALEQEGATRAAAAQKALREAQAANRGLSEQIGRIKAREVKGCETGEEIMGAGL